MLNFDADVKKTTARHQCENPSIPNQQEPPSLCARVCACWGLSQAKRLGVSDTGTSEALLVHSLFLLHVLESLLRLKVILLHSYSPARLEDGPPVGMGYQPNPGSTGDQIGFFTQAGRRQNF